MIFKSLPSSVLAWLRDTPCRWLLIMTVLGLGLRENYPFSHFPMFSSFSNRTYFIHLADADGTALRTRQFGLSNSTMKKIFDRYRRVELKHFADAGSERVRLAEAAAGQSLLRYLDGLAAAKPAAGKLLPGLQVQHVKVHQEANNLVFETRTIARHR
jgi:hypothetical protein